jgi:hypothetical protein
LVVRLPSTTPPVTSASPEAVPSLPSISLLFIAISSLSFVIYLVSAKSRRNLCRRVTVDTINRYQPWRNDIGKELELYSRISDNADFRLKIMKSLRK